ncbi:MAG: putative acyl-CoA dehydrogenase [Candidatus Poriferisodalaceae bacterium]|jgi:putative acyl-CoA dehydrogenase
MCDAFLVLAQAPAGLSFFLVPRILPDGSRNSLQLMRLKNKLGNRSNASSELEYTNAAGWLVGEEGRGVNVIIKMVGSTRIDCANWSVSLMGQAVSQAAWRVSQRSAFGDLLIEKPLMQNVLADLELETEIGTLAMMRMSGAYERAAIDEHEAGVSRMAAAVGKYWLTKQSTPVVREALELVACRGASLALRHDPVIADAYIRSRIDGDWGSEFGTLSRHADVATIARRAVPAV